LAKGVVAEEVLRVARRLRCTLIVLATHGRTGLKHVLLGSVAENVVRGAPCPVLIVRPRGYKSRGQHPAPAEGRTRDQRGETGRGGWEALRRDDPRVPPL